MSDYLPKYAPGLPVTLSASADLTGGRVLVVSGAGAVAHAGADVAVVAGVASRDVKQGETVGVYPLGGVHRLVASGAVAAGAEVASAADGKVASAGDNVFGVALSAAAADGDVIDVLTN
ncbi:capsid cement protein [Leucobacter sp. HY1908]